MNAAPPRICERWAAIAFPDPRRRGVGARIDKYGYVAPLRVGVNESRVLALCLKIPVGFLLVVRQIAGKLTQKGVQSMPIIGLLLLILDIYVIYLIITGSADTGMKLVWVILVLVLPLLGPILYLVIGRGAHRA